MKAFEADRTTEPWPGFAFRLAISLVAVVGLFAHPPKADQFIISYIGEVSWGRALTSLCVGAPTVWIVQTAFAYRHYGRKWRWFLIGAPFALFDLMVLLVVILPSYF
ncbi:hypothetical protein [Candidatus Binatus sp.]|jgi:hypothetical protein|uniref:hypothetical protein n=1 Tax=Candidatus Binatus sp. TaxID=2811406 RepID=UPI003BC904E8